MKLLMSGLLLWTGVAFAGDMAPVSYHDGTLVSFSMPSSDGNCNLISGSTCSDVDRAQYVVKSEGILYVLTPVSGAKGALVERATLGWGKGFTGYSSLYHQAPGTSIELRDDGRHIFAKVGNRESMYIAIETR
jgi:hypothetical protein